jgi:hypothetical protein
MEPLPRAEMLIAVGVLAELDWLAEQIVAEASDRDALDRQRNVAGILFTGLDDGTAAPMLRRFLAEDDIDLDAMLGWLQPGARVMPRSERLALVDWARRRLRPWVDAAVEELAPAQQSNIRAAVDRRHASFSGEAVRRQRR